MRTIILILAISLLTFTSKAQLIDMTQGGQALSVSTTYSFVTPINNPGSRYSLHVFSSNSTNDTTAFTLWQSNSQIGTGGWEAVGNGATYTLIPSDTSKIFSSFAAWGRYLRIKFVSGATDSAGTVYAIMFKK